MSWIYGENIRYGKKNTFIDEGTPYLVFADSLGYRNPEKYLEQQEKVDVLLVGDSFVWGTEEKTMADYL